MWDAYLIVLLFRGMFSTVLTFVICMINYFSHPLIIVLLHSSFACDRQTDRQTSYSHLAVAIYGLTKGSHT